MKLTKNQKLAAEKIEAGKFYAPFEALSLVKEVSSAKFDETVEVHFRLGIDTRPKALLPRPPKKLVQKSSVPTTWLRKSRLATSTSMLPSLPPT